MSAIPKRQPYRNAKILQAAKGEDCTLQTESCNHDPATTVFAHLNNSWAGKGMGQKSDDAAGFFACANCHWEYDESPEGVPAEDVLRAYYRTIRRLIDRGVLK